MERSTRSGLWQVSMTSTEFSFVKISTTGRYVRGWASVSSVGGVAVKDWQGDRVSIDEIRKAAHEFIVNVRVAKAMHEGSPVGDIVESVIIDDDFAKAIGATTDKRGWWIGMEIHDLDIRKRIRSGEYRAFSIGGKGRRKAAGA
jgi:hypothetical protein